MLSCLRGQVWIDPPAALREAMGSDPYAEPGRVNPTLLPSSDCYDVLSLDPTLLLNRIGDGLRTKLNVAMNPFGKVAFDAAQDPMSGSFVKASKFAPLSYLGEGGFAVRLSVRDTHTSVKYAMVGLPLALKHLSHWLFLDVTESAIPVDGEGQERFLT